MRTNVPSLRGSYVPCVIYGKPSPPWVKGQPEPRINVRCRAGGVEKGGVGATYPHQAISRFKLLLRLLAIINQREARAPTATKVCFESKRNDAGLVGLVLLGELFGQLVSGDRRSRRVNDVDDELTAGEEAVRGELSGANCDGGRVILRKERSCVSVRVCALSFARIAAAAAAASSIQTRWVSSSTFERGFHPCPRKNPCSYTS